MAVDPQRRLHVAVSQAGGHGWYRHAAGQHVGRHGVPKEMQRGALRLLNPQAVKHPTLIPRAQIRSQIAARSANSAG
jgi:hypothetical protein